MEKYKKQIIKSPKRRIIQKSNQIFKPVRYGYIYQRNEPYIPPKMIYDRLKSYENDDYDIYMLYGNDSSRFPISYGYDIVPYGENPIPYGFNKISKGLNLNFDKSSK